MAAAQKFLFHTDFDEPPVPVASVSEEDEAPPPPTFSEDELEAARQQGQAFGEAQGRELTLQGIEQTTADTLQNLSAQLAALGAQSDELCKQSELGGLNAALAIVGKLFPALARREEIAEIEAVVKECLQRLTREPRVVVRLSAEMLDSLQPRIDAIASEAGFEGRLVLLSGEEFGPSDVKVEWADGGAERNIEQVWDDVLTLLRHVTEQRGSPGSSPSPSSADAGATASPREPLSPNPNRPSAADAEGTAQ